jgi:hypothetical protein
VLPRREESREIGPDVRGRVGDDRDAPAH